MASAASAPVSILRMIPSAGRTSWIKLTLWPANGSSSSPRATARAALSSVPTASASIESGRWVSVSVGQVRSVRGWAGGAGRV